MSVSQIGLPLAWPADPRDDEFVVGESNEAAIKALERWGSWPVMASLLVGPRKSGRSLLARVFAAKSGGFIVDDAERVAETQVFHAWNQAQAERRPLLIVADAPPPEWQIALPDLRSRIAATPVIRIGEPDDALMGSLFEREFLRRGLDARPDLIAWLTARVERSHVAMVRVVDALDQEVLESRKRLGIPLARTTLELAGLLHARPDGREEGTA